MHHFRCNDKEWKSPNNKVRFVFWAVWLDSLLRGSQSFTVRAKEFTGARYCSWMGRRLERDRGWRGGGVELAKAHGKNWICFHSSSNKQRENFASATERTLTQRAAVSELWVSCYEQNICREAKLDATSKSSLLTINSLIFHIWSEKVIIPALNVLRAKFCARRRVHSNPSWLTFKVQNQTRWF